MAPGAAGNGPCAGPVRARDAPIRKAGLPVIEGTGLWRRVYGDGAAPDEPELPPEDEEEDEAPSGPLVPPDAAASAEIVVTRGAEAAEAT